MAENCVSYNIILSIFDIYIDQIKDLAVTYLKNQNKSNTQSQYRTKQSLRIKKIVKDR